MTENETPTTDSENGNGGTEEQEPEVLAERDGPTVPRPFERSPDIDRRIRSAVDTMLEDVQNPYEAVIVASQEARRINERRLKARSIINQAMPHIPRHKSVPTGSTISRAWETGNFTEGIDFLHLGSTPRKFYSQNQPFTNQRERQVLSLITPA